jgi:hypothetical protein
MSLLSIGAGAARGSGTARAVPFSGPPRCPHGLMLFRGEVKTGKSNYCLSCTPSGPRRTRDIVLPVDSGTALEARTIRANKKAEGRCPTCSSIVHIVIDENTWECAEDGTCYRAPRKKVR